MTKIYFSDILGFLLQFLAHSSPNPWNFLSVEKDKGFFCYVNEVAFGMPLGQLRMGAGHQRNQQKI